MSRRGEFTAAVRQQAPLRAAYCCEPSVHVYSGQRAAPQNPRQAVLPPLQQA